MLVLKRTFSSWNKKYVLLFCTVDHNELSGVPIH